MLEVTQLSREHDEFPTSSAIDDTCCVSSCVGSLQGLSPLLLKTARLADWLREDGKTWHIIFPLDSFTFGSSSYLTQSEHIRLNVLSAAVFPQLPTTLFLLNPPH